jgi:trehalose-6-phosphate synthase
VIATKRAPVEHSRRGADGPVERTTAPWAIARVLSDIALRHDAAWVASAVTDAEHELAARGPDGLSVEIAPGSAHSLHLVSHPPAVWSAVERGLSSDMLWALTNYVWDMWRTPTFDGYAHAAWAALGEFSAAYAATLAAVAGRLDDPDVLLHDYQLILVPEALRQRLPGGRILLYLHTPWPGPDYMRILPPALRRTVLRSMLGASVVGFLAHRWAANFLACVGDALPDAEVDARAGAVRHRGRTTRVAAIPLGYSPAALDAAGALPADVAAWA